MKISIQLVGPAGEGKSRLARNLRHFLHYKAAEIGFEFEAVCHTAQNEEALRSGQYEEEFSIRGGGK